MNEMDKWILYGVVLYVCINIMWLLFCVGYIDVYFCNKVEGVDIVLIIVVCF